MSKGKKILAVFGNVAYFGQERANIDVFKLLHDNGYDLQVLVHDRGFHFHLQPIFEQWGIPYQKIRYSWGLRKPFTLSKIRMFIGEVIQNNIQFMKAYRKFRPDYIHIANDFMYMCLVPSFLFTKAKIVYRLGDRPVIWWTPQRIVWNHFITKKVYRFVCDSNFVLDRLRNAGRKSDKNDIVLYSTPPSRIIKELSNSEKQLFEQIKSYRAKGKMIILYFGQISKHKGCDLLYEAALNLKKKYNDRFLFVLAGNIDESNAYSLDLLHKVQEQNCPDYIIMPGYVDNIPHLLSLCDIHIAPTLVEEPYGLIVVEAKTAHKPSIIFPVGGMKELVEHKKDGYICNNKSAQDIVDALLYYCSDENILSKQGEYAFRSLCEKEINNENFKTKWVSVYE